MSQQGSVGSGLLHSLTSIICVVDGAGPPPTIKGMYVFMQISSVLGTTMYDAGAPPPSPAPAPAPELWRLAPFVCRASRLRLNQSHSAEVSYKCADDGCAIPPFIDTCKQSAVHTEQYASERGEREEEGQSICGDLAVLLGKLLSTFEPKKCRCLHFWGVVQVHT